MKNLPNFKEFKETKLTNENFIQRGVQAVRNVARRVINWIADIFSHPRMKVGQISGGRKAEFLQDGRVAAAVYDYTGASTQAPTTNESLVVSRKNRRMMAKLNEDRVPLEFTTPGTVPNVNSQELAELVDMSFHLKRPLFIWGAPGIGKTEQIEQFCREQKLPLIFFNASVKDPTDFIGVPSVDKEKKMTIQNLPDIWPRSNGTDASNPEEGPGGIIFFDELNTAPTPVLNACLQIVQSRRLDQYILPSKWVIFAAGNREAEADVTPLSAPLSGRFRHVNYVPQFSEWESWAGSEAGTDPSTGRSKVHPVILRFVAARQSEFFHNYDPDKSASEVKMYASPRNWTNASKDLYELERRNPNPSRNMITTIIAMNVGQAIAIEFAEFYEIIKHIAIDDIKLIFTEPDKAPLPPKKNGEYKPDVTYAMLQMAADQRRGDLTIDELKNCIAYCKKLGVFEYAFSFFKNLVNKNQHVYQDPQLQGVLRLFKDTFGREMDMPAAKVGKK